MTSDHELVQRMAEAEEDTVLALNAIMQKHGLPCFLFEPIVYKIYRQVVDGKAAELAEAKNRSNVKEETYADN